MKFKPLGIFDRGILEKERIHFQVLVDVDLFTFVLFDSVTASSHGVLTGNRTSFWFGAKKVNASNHIIVYTRKGVPSSEARPDGSMYHFFFRGLDTPCFSTPDSCVVLMEINAWFTFRSDDALLSTIGVLPYQPASSSE